MRKLLFLVLVLIIPLNLFAENKETFSSFADRLNSWSESLVGFIVSADKKDATINIDKSYNIVPGMVFQSYRDGEELYHPVTNELLGTKRVVTGTIEVIRVEDKYSVCRIKDNEGIKRGDSLMHRSPLPITLSFTQMTPQEVAEIKFEILKSGLFIEQKSDYAVSCFRFISGADKASCTFAYKGQKILGVEIPVKGTKIISTSKIKEENAKKKLFQPVNKIKVDGTYSSVALGYLYGKDNGLNVVLSNGKKVFIYTVDGDKLIEKETITGFNQITNIEIADVNGNGVDELFISNLDKEKKSLSAVYEVNKNKLKLVQNNFPYFIRSFYLNSIKSVVAQSYNDGALTGMIYNIVYNPEKEEYEAYNPYTKGYGAGLFGFAYGNIGNKKTEDLIYFNARSVLSFNEYQVKDNHFGDAINYLVHTEKLSTGVEVGASGSGGSYFVYDEKSTAILIYQRIIELANGRMLLYQNIPDDKKTKGIRNFKKAVIGEYLILADTATPIIEEEVEGDAVIEADILSNGETIAFITADGWKSVFAANNFAGDTILYIVDNPEK